MTNEQIHQKLDDFQSEIDGIGPAVEESLNEAGIFTYSQLAALTNEEIFDVVKTVPFVTLEKIKENDWSGNAGRLASKKDVEKQQNEISLPENHQHYASFKIELLLNADNSVHSMSIVNNVTQEEDKWADWDSQRMLDFLLGTADVRLPIAELNPNFAKSAAPEEALDRTPKSKSTEIQAATEASKPIESGLGGNALRHSGLAILPAGKNISRKIIKKGIPFSVRLDLDLTQMEWHGNEPLECGTAVYAKRLGSNLRELVGERHYRISPRDSFVIVVPNKPFEQQGSYYIDVLITMKDPTLAPEALAGLQACTEGELIQVI